MNRFILIIVFFFIASCDNYSSNSDYFNQILINAIEKTSPSVVGVTVSKELSENNENDGFGSGLAISHDGYIVTNAHVVDQTNRITVTTMGGV